MWTTRFNRTRIKICGIRTAYLAQAAADAGADAIGLVLATDSPRHVLPGAASQIARSLPPFVMPFGVFRNPTDPDLHAWQGQWVQVHGEINEQQVSRVAHAKRVVRGLAFDPEHIRRWDQCPAVSAILVDGSAGGGGESFDHEALASMMSGLSKPIILAGGLTPENVGRAIRIVRPFAVDVSSGVESAPAMKDPILIRRFCDAVRAADASLASVDQPA